MWDFQTSWCEKKKRELTSVSVALRATATGLTPPDLISHEVRNCSESPKGNADNKKQQTSANQNDNNNNTDIQKNLTIEVATNRYVTNSSWSEIQREYRLPDDGFQYDLATVGRKPIRRKNTNCFAGAGNDTNSFRRTRSFSGNASTSNFPRLTKKKIADGHNSENLSATKYANMCRQSNQAFDSFAKGSKPGDNSENFLRWHSVGDIRRQIARDKPCNRYCNDAMKSKQEKISVSLQDLTFKDVCGDNDRTKPSVYKRIAKRYPQAKYVGKSPDENNPHWPIVAHLRPMQKPRPSLNKAFSKSEANILATKKESRSANKGILAFKRVCLPGECPTNPLLSLKRHSADALDQKSSLVNTTYKTYCPFGESRSRCPMTDGDVPFFYSMTGDALLSMSGAMNNTIGDGDISYNHVTLSDKTSTPTDSLLCNSKSTGALANLDIDHSGVSWAATPSVKKSVHEQREHLPDFSQDLEVLLTKIRSSLREKPPPLPPKSSCALKNDVASHWAGHIAAGEDDISCYAPFMRRRYDIDCNAQFRPVSSSPHRALPVASHHENRTMGISRSRSRVRSIAKRFNFSGSTENLFLTPLAVCATNNWSTELDVPEGYCRMKSLVTSTTTANSVSESPHVVKRRHCADSHQFTDHVLQGAASTSTYASTGVKMRNKGYKMHDNMSYAASTGYPKVGGTFYYGRRPVSTSYADRAQNELSYVNKPPLDTSETQPGLSRHELVNRPKVFYALDV